MEDENEYQFMYPKTPEDVRFCDLSGKPIAEHDGYFHYDMGATDLIVNEESHELLYTDEEWNEVYDDDNFYSEWDYGLEMEDMTTVPPAVKSYKSDHRYFYFLDGQQPAIKVGYDDNYKDGFFENQHGRREAVDLGTFDDIYKGFSEGNAEITNFVDRKAFRAIFLHQDTYTDEKGRIAEIDTLAPEEANNSKTLEEAKKSSRAAVYFQRSAMER